MRSLLTGVLSLCLSFFAIALHAQIITPGTTTLCVSTNMSLTDLTPGGIWSSGNTAIATVGASSGIVTGVAVGTASITYTTGTSVSSVVLTVAGKPFPMGGPNELCEGSQRAFLDSGGSAWSSSNTLIARVDSVTPIVLGRSLGYISALLPGSAVISFTTSLGCIVTKAITVSKQPGAITGDSRVCLGASTTLSNATPGGKWATMNDTIATVDTISGVVNGLSVGSVTIVYNVGSCYAVGGMTVETKPVARLEGLYNICIAKPEAMYATGWLYADSSFWESTNPSVATIDQSGGLSGVSIGTTTITLKCFHKCGNSEASLPVNVVDCYTGVKQITEERMQLDLLPNPNHGSFAINVSAAVDEPVYLEITNMLGQRITDVATTTNKINTVKIDAAAGIYLLSASTAHGRYNARVVVE